MVCANDKTSQRPLEVKEGDLLGRHITLSQDRGIIMELETMGSMRPGQRYILRCHKSASLSGEILEVDFSDPKSWIGFQYQNNQWSFAVKKETAVSCN